MVHVTVIRATTGTPRPFNDFYPLANVPHVRTCEISRVSVRVCVCVRACVYPSHTRGTVIISSSPGQITPGTSSSKGYHGHHHGNAFSRFATLPLCFFSLSLSSLLCSLFLFFFSSSPRIKHEMEIEWNRIESKVSFRKFGIELLSYSFFSSFLFSSRGKKGENISPSPLLLPGRR